MIEKFAKDKQSSLLWKFVSYGRKKFYNIDPRSQCYKTFFTRNLQMLIISKSLCHCKAFAVRSELTWVNLCKIGRLLALITLSGKAYQGQKQTLLQILLNYYCKKFYNIGHWTQCYNTFFIHNLQMLITSNHLCHWKLFSEQSNDCE